MSWLYSRALVEEYSAESCLDGEPFAPSNGNLTQLVYLPKDKMTEFSRLSRFGMTFAPLTGNLGAELLTWYQAGFRARTLVVQEKEPDSTEKEADYGEKWRESLAKYDHVTHSWKTAQCLLFVVGGELLQTLPAWGMTRNGELYPQKMPALRTKESGCGLWHPTPTKDDHKGATSKAMIKKGQSYLKYWLHARSPIASTTYPNPTFLERVMGWPIGWTELKPLAMDKFRQWLDSHGRC